MRPGYGRVQKRTDAEHGSALSLLYIGKDITMLSTLIIVLVVLWLLGVVTSYTMGGLIHILLVVAVVVVLLRIIQGRNPLQG
jgi:formate hydrogenlyase subunit 4